MRLLLRAGIILGILATACGKDSPTPVDFNDPAAIEANLSSADSAFNSDVFRSFSAATSEMQFAMSPALQPASTLMETIRPQLVRAGGQVFLPGLLQGRRLQALMPNYSASAAQGRIIPDSLYGRVFEWDTVGFGQYAWQDSTVAGLNGVRFILYATGLDGQIVEPPVAIGTLDIIDQSTPTKLQLHILVQGPGASPTYVDYTAAVTRGNLSLSATASGSISNGLSGGDNKTLSFDETLTVSGNGMRIQADFTLNNPAVELLLNESVSYDAPNIILNADFKLIQNGETIRTVGHIVLNTTTTVASITVAVSVDGHPVASISGDPSSPNTQWVDAGGEPLSPADLAALDHLFDALEHFQEAVDGLFAPINTFSGL